MEFSEEFRESSDRKRPYVIMKGKRTKRQRPSSSATSGEIEISASTKGEDEDMANCLILLAQGFSRGLDQTPRFNFNGYECKTCSRTFSSFQALGGHRASHKKLKPDRMEERRVEIQIIRPAPDKENHEEEGQEKGDQFNSNNTRSLSPTNSKSLYKVHECSVCGSEFSSGQALGGHMRRHRPPSSDSRSQEQNNKPRNILTPDLNLPPPAEDDHLIGDSSFQFKPRRGDFVLSAPALVDCHY